MSTMELEQVRTTKSSPPDEGGIRLTKNPSGIGTAMQKLNRKIFELELFERMSHETGVKLVQMERASWDEKKKLDEQQYGKLEKVEAFCDQVWKFTSSNDLYASFNKYLDMPKPTDWKFSVLDIELDPDIMELNIENDKLRAQLTNKKSTRQNLETNLIQFDMELQIAASYREKNPETICLKKCIEECEKNVNALNLKKSKVKMENSESNRQRGSMANVNEDKIYDFVTASELIEKSKIADTTRKSKFSVRKESNLSRKLAHGTKRVK